MISVNRMIDTVKSFIADVGKMYIFSRLRSLSAYIHVVIEMSVMLIV